MEQLVETPTGGGNVCRLCSWRCWYGAGIVETPTGGGNECRLAGGVGMEQVVETPTGGGNVGM